ncbi:hypothetical protein IJG78_00795 [Candidatus Saccharibacteria bacterium]|nr:hypothetical protein [Candidatus Saccharibacteria bacterium]
MLEQVVTTCMDISSPDIARAYGHLPKNKIYEWAAYQAALSVEYVKTGKGVSSTPEGAFSKKKMLDRLEHAFLERGNASDWNQCKDLFQNHLEDPGTLENFRYFCVPDSDEMIMFYKSIWTGDMASAMEYLHRWGKDLTGHYRQSPENESWYRMTEFEGIAVNERLKAQAVADLIYLEDVDNVCFFGGGNLPERLYGWSLNSLNSITLFETGKIAQIDELLYRELDDYGKLFNPDIVHIYQENLLNASSHENLLSTQDLVVMHGVSMYLGKNREGMIGALKNAKAILRDKGLMSYDYLLLTEGMKRTATAQHWPGAENMKIFNSVEEAIAEAKEIIYLVNSTSANTSFFNLESIVVNSVEPWGETSVRFLLRKRS